MRTLFVVDPLARLALAGDSSYALMLEHARRGHEVWTCQIDHLGLEHDAAVADAEPTTVRLADTAAAAFATGPRESRPLAAFDLVMMRKDPPVDSAYVHATWILEHARGHTLLVNDPRGLRELNEHLAVLRFPALTPPTIVTRSVARLAAFQREQGGTIVVKPVEGYGGLGVFVVRPDDPNTSSIYETATGGGARWTVAQKFLPEVTGGDKRILLVGGEPVGAVLRVPGANEARSNLHVGGTPTRTELDAADRAIIATVAPVLAAYGQIFVGLDVIGGRLTELNITSPTGIRHVEALEQRNVAGAVVDRLERAATARRAGR